MRKEYDFVHMKKAKPKYLRRMKAAVTMRLDTSVIAYFRLLANDIGMPYQSLINYVLSEYASRKLQPSANWGPARRRSARATTG
ncbi:MAG TPA: BrnA antitoxin family protein [Kofleriaceae bacterium]|jgi:predicted DNA binding CopG/RHH family protein|nr:BrnA antitoxin family protein [Kofleriaceae bacterium]